MKIQALIADLSTDEDFSSPTHVHEDVQNQHKLAETVVAETEDVPEKTVRSTAEEEEQDDDEEEEDEEGGSREEEGSASEHDADDDQDEEGSDKSE